MDGSRLDGGTPSAGVRRKGCWTPPPFFGGGVGPTTSARGYSYLPNFHLQFSTSKIRKH